MCLVMNSFLSTHTLLDSTFLDLRQLPHLCTFPLLKLRPGTPCIDEVNLDTLLVEILEATAVFCTDYNLDLCTL